MSLPASSSRLGAALLAATLLAPVAGQANPAADAVDAFFDWARATGATVADYRTLEETGPADAILRDAQLQWAFSFSFGETTFDLDLTLDAPETRLIGAAADDRGVAFTRFEQPGPHEIRVSGTVTEDGDTEPFEVTIRQYDLVSENYYQPVWEIAADPERPISRFLPALVASLDTRADSTTIRAIDTVTRLPDEGETTERYEGVTVTGVARGRAESYRVERTVSQTRIPDQADSAFSLRQEIGPQELTGLDVRPLMRLFGMLPADEDVGETILETIDVNDLAVTAGDVSGGVKRIASAGARVAGDAAPFDLAPLLDRITLGTFDPDEAETIALLRDLLTALEAISIDRVDVTALAVSAPDGTGTLDALRLREASYRGVSDFSLTGLQLSLAEDNTSVSLDRFRLGDLVIPPLAEYLGLVAASDTGEPPLDALLAGLPTLGTAELDALDVTSDALPAPVAIGRYLLSMRDHIGPIPTEIESRTQKAQFPVSALDDADAEALFTRLGLSVLRYADEMRLRWDETDQTLSLAPMTVEIEGGGSMDLELEIGGVPRFVFERPMQAQAALATATVNKGRLEIRDARLIEAFIAEQAEAAGLSPETLALGLADQAMTDLGPMRDTPFGRNLHAALKAFLVSPDHLVITVEPQAPVPATQILGLFATTPTMLPELLNVAIAANP